MSRSYVYLDGRQFRQMDPPCENPPLPGSRPRARLANQMRSIRMLLQFCRLPEAWPSTPSYERLRRQGKSPPSHAYIRLLNSKREVVGWNPNSPDERLYMLSQIQVELSDSELCEEVLKGVNNVAQDVASQFRLEGNAWDLAADSSGVEFTYSIMDGEPGGKVNLKTYLVVLGAWRQFIADGDCNERTVEIPEG